MRDRILYLKQRFERNLTFTATQDDIDFLEKSQSTIEDIKNLQVKPNQILKLLQNCKNAFALMINKSLSPETIELCFEQYIKHLSDCSVYFLSEAFDIVIKTKKFFPSIAEILEVYNEVDEEKYGLWKACEFYLIHNAKVSILPRTTEHLKLIMQKKDNTKIECDYLSLMERHYSEIYREAIKRQ